MMTALWYFVILLPPTRKNEKAPNFREVTISILLALLFFRVVISPSLWRLVVIRFGVLSPYCCFSLVFFSLFRGRQTEIMKCHISRLKREVFQKRTNVFWVIRPDVSTDWLFNCSHKIHFLSRLYVRFDKQMRLPCIHWFQNSCQHYFRMQCTFKLNWRKRRYRERKHKERKDRSWKWRIKW